MIFGTATLLAAGLVVTAAEAWRIRLGRAKARPAMDRAVVAMICGMVSWQSLNWLLPRPPLADQARVVAVWVQSLAGLGIAVLVLLHGLIPAAPLRPSRRG